MNMISIIAALGYITAGTALTGYLFFNLQEKIKKFGLIAFYFSFIFIAIDMIIEFTHSSSIPSVIMFLVISNVIFLVVMNKWKIENLAVIISPFNLILIIIHAVLFYKGASGGSGGVLNPWFYIHLAAFMFSYAGFTLAAFCSILYLYQARCLKKKQLEGAFLRLPSLKVMDSASYRFMGIGFPVLVLGIYSGSLWSHIHWGTYWTFKSGGMTAVIITVLYLICIHIRMVNKWQGVKINIMLVIAFLLMLLAIIGAGHIDSFKSLSSTFNPLTFILSGGLP